MLYSHRYIVYRMRTEKPAVYCPVFPQLSCPPRCPNHGEAKIFQAHAGVATELDQETVQRLEGLGVDTTVFTTEALAATAATTQIDPERCYWEGMRRLAGALGTLPEE